MREVAVGKDCLVHVVLPDKLLKLILGIDRNPVGIKLSCEYRRVRSPGDVRNLRGRESYDIVPFIVAEVDIEIVEVAPRSAHDDHSCFVHVLHIPSFHRHIPTCIGEDCCANILPTKPSTHPRPQTSTGLQTHHRA